MLIRKARPSDAEELVRFINELMQDGKSFYSDSLDYSVEEYKKFLDASSMDSFTFTYVVEMDQALIGWAILSRRRYKYKFHVANLVLGIKEQFRHQGIGTQLVNFIESDILQVGIEQIDVFIRAGNRKAYSFFKLLKYIQYGYEKQSLKIDSVYEDEVLMSKSLI